MEVVKQNLVGSEPDSGKTKSWKKLHGAIAKNETLNKYVHSGGNGGLRGVYIFQSAQEQRRRIGKGSIKRQPWRL